MTRSTRVALTGFLGVFGLSLTLTQGCGQAFKFEEPQEMVLQSFGQPTPDLPVAIANPLAIDNVAQFAGKVRLVRSDSADFNSFSSSLDSAVQQSINSLFQRLLVFSPGFDSKLNWYNRGWVFTSLNGIPASELSSENDPFILRDSAGNRLYIEPNVYAANVLDSNFRSYWLNKVRALISKGYKGIFINDVKLKFAAVNSSGTGTSAVHNGLEISAQQWQSGVAIFAEEIAFNFPGAEIVHNSDWSADSANDFSSDAQTRLINSARIQYMAGGIREAGITAGTLGLNTIVQHKKYIDRVHTLKKSIVLGGVPTSLTDKEFSLAYYYLFTDGTDFIFDENVHPGSVWTGYNIDLGTPSGPAVRDNGLWIRYFSKGAVFLSEAGTPNLSLGGQDPDQNLRDLQGNRGPWTLAPNTALIIHLGI